MLSCSSQDLIQTYDAANANTSTRAKRQRPTNADTDSVKKWQSKRQRCNCTDVDMCHRPALSAPLSRSSLTQSLPPPTAAYMRTVTPQSWDVVLLAQTAGSEQQKLSMPAPTACRLILALKLARTSKRPKPGRLSSISGGPFENSRPRL